MSEPSISNYVEQVENVSEMASVTDQKYNTTIGFLSQCLPQPENVVVYESTEDLNNRCMWITYQDIAGYIVIALAILGLIGNIYTYIVLHFKYPQTTVNIYFKALAVADSIFLFSTMISELVNKIKGYNSFKTVTEAFLFYFSAKLLPDIALMVSAWLIVVLAYSRYKAVAKPIETRMTSNYTCACITTLVIFGIAGILEAIRISIVLECPTTEWGEYICRNNYNKPHNYYIDGAFYSLFYFLLPVFPLIFFGFGLICSIRKAATEHLECMPSIRRDANEITITVVAVVIVFIITFSTQLIWALTYMVPKFYCYFYWMPCEARIMDPTINLAQSINSSVNFLIYFVCNRSFRKRSADLFFRRKGKMKSTTNTGKTSTSCLQY